MVPVPQINQGTEAVTQHALQEPNELVPAGHVEQMVSWFDRKSQVAPDKPLYRFQTKRSAAAAAPSSNALESSSWTRLLTCPSLCSSGLGSRRKLWCSTCRDDSGQSIVRGVVQCQCCFLENPGHLFLSPFLTFPYASVSDTFGQTSHYSLCEVYTDVVRCFVPDSAENCLEVPQLQFSSSSAWGCIELRWCTKLWRFRRCRLGMWSSF